MISNEFHATLSDAKFYGYDQNEIHDILRLDELRDSIDKIGISGEDSSCRGITLDDVLVPINMLNNIKNIIEGKEKSLTDEFVSDLGLMVQQGFYKDQLKK